MDTSNKLHDYRSYSYHHILIACKDLPASNKFSKKITEELRDQVGAVQIPDTFPVLDGDHVVVVNGFKDGEAFIRDAEWETMFAPVVEKSRQHLATTMTLEGSMTIVEPKGFSFLEVINNISKQLKVDTSNITWVIKTVFVGYKHDNTVEYISDIKPLLFAMYDLQAKFDVAGSEYYVKFVGLSNGGSKLPGYNNVDVVSVTLGTKKKLTDAIVELMLQLQLNYDNETSALIERCKKAGLELNGRKLVYAIALHDDYGEYDVDNVVLGQRGNVDTSGNVTFPKGSSIEQMIHTVMRSSKQIGMDASNSVGTVDTIFKVYGSVQHLGDDSGITLIKFDVRKYDVPKSTSDGASINNGKTNAIEYDYMYTGKNVDILEFDMKMEMGMHLLQMMTVNNTLKNTSAVPGEPGNTKESKDSSTSGSSGTAAALDNTPKLTSVNVGTIYPSKKYDEPYVKGNVSEGTTASFDTLLSKHAQLETLGVTVKVMGNPAVLNDLNIEPADLETGKSGSTAFGEFLKGPPLIKIDVRIPANPNALVVNDKFSKEFWYKGYYRVLSTLQQFTGGVFTQTHDMISMELEDPVVTTDTTDEGPK